MKRRQYLASGLGAAGLLAGCLSTGDGGSTPTPRPMIAITDRDPLPDLPVEPSVSVAVEAASESGPSELEVTVENVADHPIEVGEERAIVFAFVTSEERRGLTLLPAGGDYPAVEPGCWRLAEPIAVAEYYGVVSLAPGEATSQRIGVWGSSDGEGCLPTGEFRLSTTYAGARDRTEDVEEREWQGSWGFRLTVK